MVFPQLEAAIFMSSKAKGSLKLVCSFNVEVYLTSTSPLRSNMQTKRLIPRRQALTIKSLVALIDFIFLLASTKIRVLASARRRVSVR